MGEQCHVCNQWEENHYLNHVAATGKLFSRLMLSQFSTSLEIPNKFMKYMTGEMFENIQLKDPSGILWHVKLVKDENGAFLQNGWKDFSIAHRLKKNDLIIFKYIGNSCFEINILESSGCEKANSYCLKIKNLYEQEKNNSIQSHSKSTQHITNSLSIQESEGTEGNEECDGLDEHEEFINKENIYFSRHTPFTPENKRRFSRLVQSVHSHNPCFISVITNTSINRSFMFIPFDFKIHLPSHKGRTILQVRGKRQTWNVGYIITKRCVGLSSCLKYFVEGNDLQVGDICLFELVNKHKNNLKLRVKISRLSSTCSLESESESEGEEQSAGVSTSDELSSHLNSTQGETSSDKSTEITKRESSGLLAHGKLSICIAKKLTTEEEKRASLLIRAVSSCNPCFISVIRPCHSHAFCVPSSFTKYLPSQNCCTTLQVPETMKKWQAKVCWNGRICRLTAGWSLFLLDNNLTAGDVCLFELNNKHKDDLQFKVGISRAVKMEPY